MIRQLFPRDIQEHFGIAAEVHYLEGIYNATGNQNLRRLAFSTLPYFKDLIWLTLEKGKGQKMLILTSQKEQNQVAGFAFNLSI